MTPTERFFLKVVITPTCWKWVGARNPKGYGTFMYPTKGEFVCAHQFSYWYHKGSVPDGLTIDHLCRNTSCVNPDHLEAVPMIENIRRGSHATKTRCKHGHEYTPENTIWLKRSSKRHAHRVCRTCFNKNARQRYHKSKLKMAIIRKPLKVPTPTSAD